LKFPGVLQGAPDAFSLKKAWFLLLHPKRPDFRGQACAIAIHGRVATGAVGSETENTNKLAAAAVIADDGITAGAWV
jgi:hypothetical protein